MSAILLDTNAYVRYLGGDERVLGELGRADTVFLSVFVMGELFAGFAGGSRARQNRDTLDAFVGRPSVQLLDATRETAEVFGALHDSMKKAGTPLPTNDLWIAAHAFETGSVLVTFDEHFERIPNLRVLRFEPSS
ncbi:MAG: type II toxin-antitoxin system VapC family toxin [Spirochaetes bacterium]|nr:type II toxin-antitoxin system VapC family toxin [Spirochaetota bacterium]